MPSREENENQLAGTVSGSLRRWLTRARDVVMKPFRTSGTMPDADAIFSTQPAWDSEVDTILTHIGRIAMDAWSEATDVPPVSRHAFVMAQLAMTQNFLVRIPDEVYSLVFAEIVDGTNAGESVPQVANRVDRVLTFTGSENWPNRARVIAQTETTRAYGAGTLAAGFEQARVTGRVLRKRWDATRDNRVRPGHREVDGDTVQLWMPFYVDGVPLMFPGDPTGPPETVINCRCDLMILNEEGR